ncbi:MAG: class I SAM-dependent methyltransferase [Betaproteobacteria bacterium]|nr:class I SAM-dependent methyltransferase [Betaproteobacteria bacterium]
MASPLRPLISSLGTRTALSFETTFADGSVHRNRAEDHALKLRFNSLLGELRALAQGHVGFLEAYFDGQLDVDGDFALPFRIAFESGFESRRNPLVWIRNQWHELRYSNRRMKQAKNNARFHYCLGEDFYGQWLDRDLMMYTCAYWKEGATNLEEAQRNKGEHVCKKVRLRPGDSVVDIGCGFGGFMFHARQHHGARVTGLNNASEQVPWLRDEISRRGMNDSLSVREADFREVDKEYDKVVSIGVLEHAGRDQLEEVVQAHARFLKRGGLGMLHFIGHVGVRDTEFYIRKHVFPGGWIPSLSETLAAMEACGLEVLDVENLRRHYAHTLDAWAERFDSHWPRIQALNTRRFNERFRRVWRTYLYSCAEMFRSPRSNTGLFQIVFSKGNVARNAYPMSRFFLYAEDTASSHAPVPEEATAK